MITDRRLERSIDSPDSPLIAVVVAVVVFSLLVAGVGAVSMSGPTTGDAGAVYIGYKYHTSDLDDDSLLAGASAVLGGTGSAASGAATYVSASGTAAALGAGAATTGGLLAL